MDFKSFIVIFLMAFSVNVSAEKLYSCAAGCNNLSQEALKIARNSSPGTRYSVLDFNNNRAKTYVSELLYNTSYGEPLERAVEVSTSSNAINTLNEINEAKRDAENSRYQVPASIAPSAYNLIAIPQTKVLVARHIKENTSLWGSINDFLSIAEQKLAGGVLPAFIIVVNFDDGSTAAYSIANISYTEGFVFAYVPESATSKSGIKIPTKDSDFLGVYKFENLLEANNFGGLAGIHGVLFKDSGICTQAPIVTCTKTSEGRYECVAVRQCP
jgi:hypothetical protein